MWRHAIERTLWILGMLSVAALLSGMAYVKTAPIPEGGYAGSARCQNCHRKLHSAWRESQHTRMMRPATAPGVVVADFADPQMPFDPAQAVWAIGGKWEQQFMGSGPEGETLLAGAWQRAENRWEVKGWDGWDQPVPLTRCHGCHTLGLDVTTGQFVEPNIGCESCHGPALWHANTWGLGRVASLADADVCGQCHARGKDPSGRQFFPDHYRPGERVEDGFSLSEPSPGQNTTDWWGNGRARSRHQEFNEWRRGGHANSLRSLREGYDGRFGALTGACLRCHAGDAILFPERELGMEQASQGITCSVCHNVHGELDRPRRECADCHEGGAYYHAPERNAAHVPCPSSAAVGCADCHMPRVVRIAGRAQLHSHAPGVVPPSDGAAYSMPTSCTQAGCHAGADLAALQRAFERHPF
jgi:hypothetical protein